MLNAVIRIKNLKLIKYIIVEDEKYQFCNLNFMNINVQSDNIKILEYLLKHDLIAINISLDGRFRKENIIIPIIKMNIYFMKDKLELINILINSNTNDIDISGNYLLLIINMLTILIECILDINIVDENGK
ncbi:hypothetical protein BCR32DRAFT_278808 [Anaeromyces robustus]|uniref:Uncharacterized protein n=1 Tax=Anaeromyces robustus TaxID=1754192 RepID=A0A1Y1XAN5_9FUNG|nr:hypothetical protein BCR32DRAFT_278808 [Anaeromyces robustus]|eukprot:ORX82496.1 hypothetical protein BCR32DRAFT_278808 [Anaeromyces robustus]